MIIGSLSFCDTCGNLLSLPQFYHPQGLTKCDQCGKTQKFQWLDEPAIVTRSNPNAFPSVLRQKRALVQQYNTSGADGEAHGPLMQESCPKCNHPEMRYHTLQLRSADEGTTVFYECPNCGHKFSTNN